MTTDMSPKGRGWAYLGAVLGGLVSVAANIAHSFIPPTNAPTDWSPEAGAVISAIVWPVFLFIAIEILARTSWPTGWSWTLLRWVGLPPVALVAAFVSYRHLAGLLEHYQEDTLVVWFGPIAVDGLMLLSTAALIATGKQPTRPTNPVPAPQPATDAPAPSIPDTPAAAPVRPAAATPPATNPQPEEKITAEDTTTETPQPIEPEPEPEIGTTDPEPEAQPAPVATVPVPATNGTSVPAGLLPGARIIADAHRNAHGEPITPGQLAVRLRVPTNTAADILTALNNHNSNGNNQPHNGKPVGALA